MAITLDRYLKQQNEIEFENCVSMINIKNRINYNRINYSSMI